jgi:tetratricopeptide (TPR) repeat protein
LQNRKKEIETLYHLGAVCIESEEFKQASRFYRTALSRAQNHKRYLPIYLLALIAQGFTLFRLGQWNASIEHYEAGYTLAQQTGEVDRQIDCLLGLGWVLFKQGHNKRAIGLTQQALAMSAEHEHYIEMSLMQNLGIMIFPINPEEAHNLWLACLTQYRETNDLLGQVTILEELGRYHIFDHEYLKTDYLLREGLKLSHSMSNVYSAGRLYRALGDLAASEEKIADAREYYQLALGCFKTLHAEEELRETAVQIDRTYPPERQ